MLHFACCRLEEMTHSAEQDGRRQSRDMNENLNGGQVLVRGEKELLGIAIRGEEG